MSCYVFVVLLPDGGSSELKACSSQAAQAVLDTFSVLPLMLLPFSFFFQQL